MCQQYLKFYLKEHTHARTHAHTHTHTHTHTRRWSGTTRVGRYQKSKTNLDFTEARDSEWQWHHLGHMQVCTALQTDNHASTPPLKFFTGQTPFLPPNQQRQSTEGTEKRTDYKKFSDVVVVNAYQENEKQLLRWHRRSSVDLGFLQSFDAASC